MKKAIKFLAYGVAALAALVVVILAIGATLPVEHTASAEARYDRPPEEVWAAITDYRSFPEWRSGVDRIEERSFEPGQTGWVEYGSTGVLPLSVVESSPPRRQVLRIASDELPFGGTWTYELEPDGAGTRLQITEDGTISNLFFRFMARFVFGYTATMEQYLVDLGSRLGEEVEPETAVR